MPFAPGATRKTDTAHFDFQSTPDDYLVFFGRIHTDKGAREALNIARACDRQLVMAGIIQDQAYYDRYVAPHIDNDRVV